MQDFAIYKRPRELCKIFSISRATLYRYAKDPAFPKPLKPTKKVTLWNVREIEKYLKNKTTETIQ